MVTYIVKRVDDQNHKIKSTHNVKNKSKSNVKNKNNQNPYKSKENVVSLYDINLENQETTGEIEIKITTKYDSIKLAKDEK